MREHFEYRGYSVEIDANEREADGLGPRVLVSMLITRVRDGAVLFQESPIRMLPANVVITEPLAIEYRRDEARRRIDRELDSRPRAFDRSPQRSD